MPTLGSSYVLKLLSMNEKPRRTEIKKRFLPSGDGYDFHRSLRRFARRLLIERVPLADLIEEADGIKNLSERSSLKAALQKLDAWRSLHSGPLLAFSAGSFPSPGKLFNIRFEPDFGLVIDGRATAIHIWNTKRPPLVRRGVLGALSWLPEHYAAVDNRPDDFAVLSLQDGTLIRLSESREAPAIGAGALSLLQVFEGVRGEIAPPPASDDRPKLTRQN